MYQIKMYLVTLLTCYSHVKIPTTGEQRKETTVPVTSESILNVFQGGRWLEDTDSYSLLGTIKSKLACLARQAASYVWGNFPASFHSSGSLFRKCV